MSLRRVYRDEQEQASGKEIETGQGPKTDKARTRVGMDQDETWRALPPEAPAG